jgi:hypothetical protein
MHEEIGRPQFHSGVVSGPPILIEKPPRGFKTFQNLSISLQASAREARNARSISPTGATANRNGAARFQRREIATQSPLSRLDSHPALLRVRVEEGHRSSHTGPHGIGQKSPDSSAIPLCAKHHRTGPDSYHRLGPRKFSERHNLDIPEIVRRLNSKPTIRVEAGCFVTYLDDHRYVLGKTDAGIRPAVCKGFTTPPGESAVLRDCLLTAATFLP